MPVSELLHRATASDIVHLRAVQWIDAQDRLVADLGRHNVRPAEIEAYLGYPLTEMSPNSYEELQGYLVQVEEAVRNHKARPRLFRKKLKRKT